MTEDVDRRVLSHGHTDASLAETVAALHRRLRVAGDRPDATVLELLDLVDALASFPFGRFLLQNRGWNGFWTDFVMTHPERGRSTGTAPDGRRLTPLERQLLDTFPTVLATQQRSRHFARVIQAHIRDNVRLASCPSGLMRDLLARDYRGRCGVTLIGIDIDEESLAAAARLADAYGLARAASFVCEDAWSLTADGAYDLLASNGLSIYEPNDARVTSLYHAFARALKPGGTLVTSFLTPPPTVDPASPWHMRRIDRVALRLQKLVFVYILDARFQCYRTPATTEAQLRAAGFTDIALTWDEARIFPTVTARKRP